MLKVHVSAFNILQNTPIQTQENSKGTQAKHAAKIERKCKQLPYIFPKEI